MKVTNQQLHGVNVDAGLWRFVCGHGKTALSHDDDILRKVREVTRTRPDLFKRIMKGIGHGLAHYRLKNKQEMPIAGALRYVPEQQRETPDQYVVVLQIEQVLINKHFGDTIMLLNLVVNPEGELIDLAGGQLLH